MKPINLGRRIDRPGKFVFPEAAEQMAAAFSAELRRHPSKAKPSSHKKPGRVNARRVPFEHPVFGNTFLDEVEANPPTPDEIAERAAEVRAGWSEYTEKLRREGFIGAVPVSCEPITPSW